MGYRKNPFVTGEYYHLYNRGVEKRKIFLDKQDYSHFRYLMYVCNTTKNIKTRDLGKDFDRGETLVNIGAYCLMPNHFHILVREKKEHGISLFMRKLLTAYSMYFNIKYKRSGRLYENTFKSSNIGDDRYLKYMFAYIHLNPAKLIDKKWREKPSKKKEELYKFISEYKLSSLGDYIRPEMNKEGILNKKVFPSYFDKVEFVKEELFEWLTYHTG